MILLNRGKDKGAVKSSFLFGALLFVLVSAGGIIIFSRQQDNVSLTADVLQIVDSIDNQKIVQPEPQIEASPSVLASQKVLVSPTSIPAGGEIEVIVDASATPGFISFVDVYLENVSTQQTVRGSIVNINGEGRRFGNITIPSDADQGIWLVKRVSIVGPSDVLVDYYDGQDMLATFTVIAP